MELRHLRYFVTVAAEGSFTRAAEKLHIAQSPLGRQIQQLEEELQVRLLHRQRPVRLTEAGRFFCEQAEQLLKRVDEVQGITRRIAMGGLAKFTIGFVASTLYENLPELIKRFRRTAPDVEVALSEMTTFEQMAALKQGRIDVGFGRLRFDDPSITREVLREEPLAVALPHGHLLLQRASHLRLLDTVEEPLIIYPAVPRPSYADQVLSLYRDRGGDPHVTFEVRELQTALGLVAAGAGICIVPTSVRRLGRTDISYIEMNEAGVVSPIILSYRSEDKSPWITHLRALAYEFESWSGALCHRTLPHKGASRCPSETS